MQNEISKVYSDIAELLEFARSRAYHSVNSIMVETYWKIGQRIVVEVDELMKIIGNLGEWSECQFLKLI